MYSFEEIMDFYPDNINVYNEIKRNLPVLVPFVGAGLSQFAYCSWSGALVEIAKNITEEKNFYKVEQLINKNGKYYLKAAQLLEDFRTPTNLERDIANLFSPEKLNKKQNQLVKQAIFLLPLLFSGLVITTNFDQTLETVYEAEHSLYKVFEPNQLSLLNQYLSQVSDYPGIFKLHGTISGNFVEYDRIVFTEKQYDKFYRNGSPLTKALKKCLTQKTILFLGCSLSQDRTMDILQMVLEKGKSYYTIINCEKDEVGKKVRELGKKHIRAIVYEGERHEAVRVILEHLLKETRPDTYSYLTYHEGELKSLNDNRFTYKSDILPLVGRKEEMKRLNDFLDDSKTAFKWWAITGPGGCGKSRLAYEFQNRLPFGWKSRFLSSEDYDNLSIIANQISKKTLFIVDYVQEHAKDIGRFMAKLNKNSCNFPIRVLLIEREANNELCYSSWLTQLFSDIHNASGLKKACYQKEFLVLQPLSDHDLKDVIKNYALAMQNNADKINMLQNNQIEMLLQKLKTIDPDFYRPLYAMFLTDAYIEGKNPDQWNREDALDYVVERESDRLKFNIKHIMGSHDRKLLYTCEYLQCAATALLGISLDELKELFPKEWNIIERKSDRFESPEELLTKIGLIVNNEIPAVRPDLVGEYYVFNWLIKHDMHTVHCFLNAIWHKSLLAAFFLDRIINDYKQFINENQEYWNVFVPPKIDLSVENVLFYSMFISNLTGYCNMIDRCVKYINILEHLYIENYDTTEIAVSYARGLYNLSNKQEETEAKQTIECLEYLCLKHSDVTEIAIWFARGLFNLSNRQKEQSAVITINKLEELSYKYTDVRDITIVLAMGLFNLLSKQEEQSAIKTVRRLEKLSYNHSEFLDTTIVFAKGLVNLCIMQEEHSALKTVDRLENLSSKHPDVMDITTAFAKGLVFLIGEQGEVTSIATLKKLEKLYEEHVDVIEIIAEFAKGLINMIVKMEDQLPIEKAVNKLEDLYLEHPNIMDITVAFAKGLLVQINKQDRNSAQMTVDRLEKLYLKHSDEKEMAITFASGLYNLTIYEKRQSESETAETTKRLEKLSLNHPNVTEITVLLAKSLHNLCNRQEEKSAIETVDKLENLSLSHPDVIELLTSFAWGLVSLTDKQLELSAIETVYRLENLASQYPDVKEIIIAYASGLYNFSNAQIIRQHAMETVEKLEQLALEYSDVTEITIIFAKGLANIIYDQEETQAIETVEKLEELTLKYPGNKEIMAIYATGLLFLNHNQRKFQGAEKSRKTMEKFKKVIEENPFLNDIISSMF